MKDDERKARVRLSEWFRQWRAPLRRFLVLRWSVRPSDSDDVAQEVFLRLLRYERSELIEHPQAYLFKVASNVAAERAMRSVHRAPHDARWLSDLRAEGETEPESVAVRAAAEEHLRRTLGRLAPRAREVLRLHFGEGLSHAEIAARLGVTQRIVKRDLINSYARLRVELDTEIVDSLRFGGSHHGVA